MALIEMEVSWIKCEGDHWCPLAQVDLTSYAGVDGVYFIWNPKIDSRHSQVVRVGQGDIQDRLVSHRNDPEITKYGGDDLLVTWAVEQDQLVRSGIERYLAERLNPLVGSRFPDVNPIRVNIPGS